ncbi:hypothetical protein [uncultured Mediterranean phage]|nr:hypothetical protein [uncultured Mediterranean phage]
MGGKGVKMKQESKKQQAKKRAYKKAKAEVEKELKAQNKWVCIFTGRPIPDYITWKDIRWHHVLGRDGDLMTDKKFIRPYLDENAHTGDYGFHSKGVSELKSQYWWEGFMSRVKEIDYDLWYSLKLKENV